MALLVVHTQEEALAGRAVVEALREAVAAHGAGILLVPTFGEGLQAQKALACAGVAMGVEVGTPRSWARDRWDVWGDGRRVADASQRTLLMSEVLDEAIACGGSALANTPGTVRLLCDLAERCLPWAEGALHSAGTSLTSAEAGAVRLLAPYARRLEAHGLVEGASVMAGLPQALCEAGVAVAPVVCAGFRELAHAERALLCGLARHADVTYVARTGTGAGFEQAARCAALLLDEASSQGVAAGERRLEDAADAPRCAELAELSRALFASDGARVRPTGAVRLLHPTGPLAEAELVAREVMGLVAGGPAAARVAVVVPDVRRAWRELAPKLTNRGIGVVAQLGVPVLKTQAGRAFVAYARTVARMSELSDAWPPPREGTDGQVAQLGSMDWWPPQDLVDFLLSDVSHVEARKAHALDVAWRGNRLLSPSDVLARLLGDRATSPAVARSTRELLRGRLGSAASKLLAPYASEASGHDVPTADTGSLAREEAVAALAAVMGVAGTLKELGVTADPSCEGAVSLGELVGQAELALGATSVSLRVEAPGRQDEGEGAQGTRPQVALLTRAQAAVMEPASFDAVVLCGLTSQELAVPTGDDLLDGMLCALGMEPAADPLVGQRAEFLRLCSLPSRHLLLERPLFSADSHETYPAVMLSELLSCYGGELPGATLAEDAARQNVSACGREPSPEAFESPAPSGHIDDGLRRLVIVPQEGQAELPGGLPVLSASQLESYLECPLKWFSLRRLRLQDTDAGFGPLQMGTFAHRVLELTYAQLFQEGRARLALGDAEGLAHAHEVLDACFSLHEEHQYLCGPRPAPQALVAHSAAEEAQMDRLRKDLSSTLDYVSCRLLGYEPRAFEWEFGRGGHTARQEGLAAVAHATYAGVAVTGTVDRIDVNAHGQAVVIDYKHKGPAGFFGEYAVFPAGGHDSASGLVLPRRIQALMYAQVVRRAFPDLRVVGALYLGTRGSHELSGAVDQNQADAVFGATLSSRRAERVVVAPGEAFGQPEERGMTALLDATEQAVAQKVERMRAGLIEADPIDEAACAYCPVSNCERRMQ